MINLKVVPKSQLQRTIEDLKLSSFTRNFLVVMTGTGAAQVLGFAMTPVISRLFSPTDFGVYGSFNAVLYVIASCITLDYNQALMLPKEKQDAFSLLLLSCLSTALIASCCLLICLFAPELFRHLIKTNNTLILPLMVTAVLFSGIFQSCQAWCVRVKAFKRTSSSHIIRSVSMNATQVGLGYSGMGALGLIFGNILADICATLNLFRTVRSDTKIFRHSINPTRMKKLAFEYRDFPIYSSSKNFVNALSSGLPIILLTHFFGIGIAGAYAFGFRIVGSPMEFILRPLRQVLFQKASETQHKGTSLASLYIKVTLGLFVLAFFPVLLFSIWAPQIFTWIFGLQWQSAGQFARVMVLWLLFAFCNLPAVQFARIIRIQRTVFIFELFQLAVSALCLVLGGFYLNALNTILIFCLVSAFTNLLLIFMVGNAVIKREKDITGRAPFDNG